MIWYDIYLFILFNKLSLSYNVKLNTKFPSTGCGGLRLIWYYMIWYDMIWFDMIWYNIISYYFITNWSWVEPNIFPCAAPPAAVSATGCLALGVLESLSRSRSASSSAEIWIWLEGAGPKQNTNRSQTTARESLKTENENAQKLITIRPGGSTTMENTKHPYLT